MMMMMTIVGVMMVIMMAVMMIVMLMMKANPAISSSDLCMKRQMYQSFLSIIFANIILVLLSSMNTMMVVYGHSLLKAPCMRMCRASDRDPHPWHSSTLPSNQPFWNIENLNKAFWKLEHLSERYLYTKDQ